MGIKNYFAALEKFNLQHKEMSYNICLSDRNKIVARECSSACSKHVVNNDDVIALVKQVFMKF